MSELGPGPFAVLRCAVWTFAALRVVPRLAGYEQPIIRAAAQANQFLEVWLYAWGPTFAPSSYKDAIAVLHQSMPPTDRMRSADAEPRPGRSHARR